MFATAGFKIQSPASALVRERASLAFGLSRNRIRISLSPVESPPSVKVRIPEPLKERSAVLLKIREALLAVRAWTLLP